MNGRKCFLVCLLFLLPLQVLAICGDEWFRRPPKPFSDGPDYEAIGFGLSQGLGWSTHYSDVEWFEPYAQEDAFRYARLSSRNGPPVPDTNRPPLLPTVIASTYQLLPRGPIAFAAVRCSFAIAIAVGCSWFAAWGYQLCKSSIDPRLRSFAGWTPYAMIAIVYTERNLRNYSTDFLTEPYALSGLAISIFLLWIAVRRRVWYYVAPAAIAFSLTIYCRNSFLLATPVLIAMIPVLYAMEHPDRSQRWREGWRCSFTFAVVVLLVQAPWWVRNCVVLESFRPLGTKGTTTLLGGYCDASFERGGEWQSAPEIALRATHPVQAPLEDPRSWLENEKQVSDFAAAEVLNWSIANWQELPVLVVKRILTEWNPYRGKSLMFKLLALLGVGMAWRTDRRLLLWILTPLAMCTFIAAITYSLGGRYLVPAYGCFYLLVFLGAAYFGCLIVEAGQAIRHWKSARSS